MAAFIVVKKVRKSGAKPTRFEREKLRVGRGGENDVDLDDFLVSPRHCEIEWIGGQFRLTDAGSVTGTFVDGKPVTDFFTLATGQKVTLGLNQLEIAVDLAKQECTAALTENLGTGEKTLHKVAHLSRRPWWLKAKTHMLAGGAIGVVPVLFLLALGRPGILMNGALARPHATESCAKCHTPIFGATAEKCASCHTNSVGPGTTHPMAARSVADEGCAHCHEEHRGELAKMVPAHVPPADCRRCHDDAHRDSAPGKGKRATAPREVVIRFDAFDHGAHARAGVSECATCHKKSAAPATAEFVAMDYAGCVSCHAHRGQAVEAHGTNAQCAACHAGPKEKALAVLSKAAAGATLASFGPQHHDLASRCDQCHEGKARDLPARASGKPFDHFAHVATLAPAATDAARVSNQCEACHGDIAAAAPPAATCATCHGDPHVSSGVTATTRAVVRFSHAQHRATSCLACHAFASDAPGAAPRLAGGAEECARCHIQEKKKHVSAGLDACVYCHRGANDVFDPAPAVKVAAAAIPYSHRSPGHAALACDECHADAREAARVSALRFPSFEAAACQRCHGAQGQAGGDLDCMGCHVFHHDKTVTPRQR